MAKDPAVLFYTSDFLSGTFTMTNDERGMYITLLCIQHQKDYLMEKDMLSVCKAYVEQVYSKFIKTDAGYYNERMKIEKEKRGNYCQSRRDSVLKGIDNKLHKHTKSVRNTYVKRMEDENENINDNINKDKIEKNKRPNKIEISDYFNELGVNDPNIQAESFHDYYTANGWKVGGNPMKDWKAAARNWKKNINTYKSNGQTSGKKSAYELAVESRRKLASL